MSRFKVGDRVRLKGYFLDYNDNGSSLMSSYKHMVGIIGTLIKLSDHSSNREWIIDWDSIPNDPSKYTGKGWGIKGWGIGEKEMEPLNGEIDSNGNIT